MSQVEAIKQTSGVDLQTARKEHRKRHRHEQRVRGADTGRDGSLGERVLQAYLDAADPITETLLVTWAAFGTTFGLARVITHGIRGGWLPLARNVTFGAKHLHHYNWGIAMLAGVGLIALHGSDVAIRHPYAGSAYGIGAALIADEAALLLELEDVYWTKKGHMSIDVGISILSLLGVYVVAAPFWDDVVREIRRTVGPA